MNMSICYCCSDLCITSNNSIVCDDCIKNCLINCPRCGNFIRKYVFIDKYINLCDDCIDEIWPREKIYYIKYSRLFVDNNYGFGEYIPTLIYYCKFCNQKRISRDHLNKFYKNHNCNQRIKIINQYFNVRVE